MKPEYRFKCEVVDETTGEVVSSASTYLSPVSENGECESAETEVGSMLRTFERFGRDEYERTNYQQGDNEAEE